MFRQTLAGFIALAKPYLYIHFRMWSECICMCYAFATSIHTHNVAEKHRFQSGSQHCAQKHHPAMHPKTYFVDACIGISNMGKWEKCVHSTAIYNTHSIQGQLIGALQYNAQSRFIMYVASLIIYISRRGRNIYAFTLIQTSSLISQYSDLLRIYKMYGSTRLQNNSTGRIYVIWVW